MNNSRFQIRYIHGADRTMSREVSYSSDDLAETLDNYCDYEIEGKEFPMVYDAYNKNKLHPFYFHDSGYILENLETYERIIATEYIYKCQIEEEK